MKSFKFEVEIKKHKNPGKEEGVPEEDLGRPPLGGSENWGEMCPAPLAGVR